MSSVSVSVEVLLAPVGSLLPTGAATVAVLTSEPVAVGRDGAGHRERRCAGDGEVDTVALMLPLPDAGQLEPAVAVHVQVTPVSVAGNVSATVAPVIADGPAMLVATIV